MIGIAAHHVHGRHSTRRVVEAADPAGRASPFAGDRCRTAAQGSARSGHPRNPAPRRSGSRRRRRRRPSARGRVDGAAPPRDAVRPRRRVRSTSSRVRVPRGTPPRCLRAGRGSRRTRAHLRRVPERRLLSRRRPVVHHQHVRVGQLSRQLLEHLGKIRLFVPGGDENDGLVRRHRRSVERWRQSPTGGSLYRSARKKAALPRRDASGCAAAVVESPRQHRHERGPQWASMPNRPRSTSSWRRARRSRRSRAGSPSPRPILAPPRPVPPLLRHAR